MTEPEAPALTLRTPPELNVNLPEGREWRHTIEGCALSALLEGGSALIDDAKPDIRPSDFDGSHRRIYEAMLDLRREGYELTAANLSARVAGTVEPDLLALLIAVDERKQTRPRRNPDPLWLQRESLNDFLRELRREKTVLYFWYDADDVLLYIGITGDLATRQSSHAKRSSWAEFADHSKVYRFPSRPAAERAEKAAIEQHRPLFNRQHNDTPEARARLVAYLIEHGRMDLLAPAVSHG